MIGSDDATIETPPDEYQIAILGDSFLRHYAIRRNVAGPITENCQSRRVA